ncbi:Site-specific recombinase [Moraxella cuniculi]|uniref:Site-specific recombinase n=2 Tax=Moraxella cuniculi TaxID=34061 RepID=A0A3S4UL38_9GAMM|nr:Site-specific recombinase [Moraxella cuniculi]
MLTDTSGLEQILQRITMLQELPEPESLKRLIDALRVADGNNESADAKIDELIEILRTNPEYGAGLAAFILRLINKYRQITLYTDTGIASDQSFSSSVSRLISHRFLPLLPEEDSVVELANYLFDKRSDWRWVESISEERWDELVQLIRPDEKDLSLVAQAKNSILNAIVVLSYRISGIGLHPELMNFYPELLNYSAAFVAQNQEAILFVNQYRQAHELDLMTDVMPENDIDPAPLMVMVEQCEDIVDTLRKRVYKTGISIRLTNMLARLEQSLQRMRTLVELVSDAEHKRDQAVVDLTVEVVQTAKTRYSFGSLIESNTRLLSRKVTENASRVGEHYISTDSTGYRKMYQKAAIGGLFIGFMATLKTLAYHLALAPIGRAFVNSMIYGLGFVFIHIARGTVATKQPAMTAAAIASTISESSGKKTQQLTKLSELIVDILRTQFVAILGNISVAMPVALLIAMAWSYFQPIPMIDGAQAAKLLHELDPIRSLALPHAAIAGVFLFVSGLIAGYYDNLAAYNKIGERIRRHWLLIRLMPKRWLDKLGGFVEVNLGAIMGNFIFGCFLGSTATVGYMLGLPLDIRHIAFASANFVHGLYYLSPEHLTWQVITLSFIGVLLIGFVNLMVSFSLALMVALRSKEVKFMEWKRLYSMVVGHFFARPLDFFWPRKQTVKYAKINSFGEMIFEEASPAKETRFFSDSIVRRLGRKPKEKEEAEKADNQPEDIREAIEAYHNDELDNPPKSVDDAEDDEIAINPLPKPANPPKLPK